MIPFNRPYVSGSELTYIASAIASGKLSGDGVFTKKCHAFFESYYSFRKVLLTTSCTDALEMAAILLNIKPGDEVIAPAFTFVSTVNAFVLRGASIIFADSSENNPNIDAAAIRTLITSKTKAIIVVHYAGVACDMGQIMTVATEHGIPVIEDAAQAIDSYYEGQPLGGIGALGTLSFHETKNIICGEGGLLIINDFSLASRAEVIREKGTNRSAFFRGEIDKYGWTDIGSSFLPSDIVSAFLFAQLENLKKIQLRRIKIWEQYRVFFEKEVHLTNRFRLCGIPDFATNNAHMFYLVCDSLSTRSGLIDFLRSNGVHAVFHYLSLHRSPYYSAKYCGNELIHCDRYADCLVRQIGRAHV